MNLHHFSKAACSQSEPRVGLGASSKKLRQLEQCRHIHIHSHFSPPGSKVPLPLNLIPKSILHTLTKPHIWSHTSFHYNNSVTPTNHRLQAQFLSITRENFQVCHLPTSPASFLTPPGLVISAPEMKNGLCFSPGSCSCFLSSRHWYMVLSNWNNLLFPFPLADPYSFLNSQRRYHLLQKNALASLTPSPCSPVYISTSILALLQYYCLLNSLTPALVCESLEDSDCI